MRRHMEVRVICPGCRVHIPETATICDHCNTVIDRDPSAGGDDTSPGVANPLLAGPTTATALDDEAPKAGSGLLEGQLASAAAIEDLRNEIRAFAPSEKMTLGGIALLMLGLGLPWRASRVEPTEIGLVAGGWPTLVAIAGVVVVLVHFLRRKDWALPYRDLFLGGAVVASFLSTLGAAAFIKLNDVTRDVVGMAAVREIWPREGAYLALFGALICLSGTLVSLLRRKSLPG